MPAILLNVAVIAVIVVAITNAECPQARAQRRAQRQDGGGGVGRVMKGSSRGIKCFIRDLTRRFWSVKRRLTETAVVLVADFTFHIPGISGVSTVSPEAATASRVKRSLSSQAFTRV